METPKTRSFVVANVVIAVWLAAQIALPLRYYTGNDTFDERFAWRMFSPVRIARCSVQLFDAGGGSEQSIRLSSEIHVVWINLMKRARLSVLDAYARKFCSEALEAGRAPVLRADLTCPEPGAAGFAICVRGTRDRDGDGVPDGFADKDLCPDGDAAACYATECGERDAATCYEARCRVRPVERDANLCERVGVTGSAS